MRRRNLPERRHCQGGSLSVDIAVTVPTEAVADGLDGAVLELYLDPVTGYWAADVRIPAPEVSDGRTETLARQDL